MLYCFGRKVKKREIIFIRFDPERRNESNEKNRKQYNKKVMFLTIKGSEKGYQVCTWFVIIHLCSCDAKEVEAQIYDDFNTLFVSFRSLDSCELFIICSSLKHESEGVYKEQLLYNGIHWFASGKYNLRSFRENLLFFLPRASRSICESIRFSVFE